MKTKAKRKIKDFKLHDFNKKNMVNKIRCTNDYIEFNKEEINQSIICRFNEQVKKYSNKIAVKTDKNAITYNELNVLSNQIGHLIFKELGYDNDGVALLFEHGINAILGILGVLKANKLYIPLDPEYPIKRLKYMLNHSNAKVLVTNDNNIAVAKKLKKETGKKIKIININKNYKNAKKNDLNLKISPKNLAYIIYTSGSTGRPKGVMQCHRNILHFIRVYTNNLHISSDDNLTFFSSYSFDASVMDIFGALLNGSTLYPLDIKKQENINKLSKWLRKEKISIFHSTPTLYRYFIDNINKEDTLWIRLIVLGGEVVSIKDVENYKKYFSDDCIFINGLGPTESTVTLQYFVDKSTKLTRKLVSVGFPVDETEVLLINKNNKETNVYEAGEIVYKSEYLALGYLNDIEKTKKVFVKNPLDGKSRVYRTGDVGRRLPDGSIEFLGREDSQVKRRGFRIELNEIESVLDGFDGIRKSIVVCRQNNNGENILVAYYEKNKETNINNFKKKLRGFFPDYMLPNMYVSLNKIPLDANGKINRKAILELPIPQYSFKKNNIRRPRNKKEKKLLEIWSNILKINKDKISIDDDFFDLGGHSLKAMAIAAKIHEVFNVNITLKEIYQCLTIKNISFYIENIEKNSYLPIAVEKNRDYYPVSFGQKRLLFLNQIIPEQIGYNVPCILEITGELDYQQLNKALQKLIQRHESLRTSFTFNEGEPVQIIHSEVAFSLNVTYQDQLQVAEMMKEFVQPFSLNQAPLFRANLVHTRSNSYLLIDLHHIVADGTSINILIQELLRLYTGSELPQLNVQFKDFAIWQRDMLQLDLLKNQEKYWLTIFSGELPILNLVTDYARPQLSDFSGDNYCFTLNEEKTAKLREFSISQGVSLYVMLLALYNILLHKYTQQEDIIVGSPTIGRTHPDVEKIIGFFVNTIALRNYPCSNLTILQFLKKVKENFLSAWENQDYQFEFLVEKLDLYQDIGRNPIFDTMLTFQNFSFDPIESEEVNFKSVEFYSAISKFDITLFAKDTGQELCFQFQYRTSLFKRKSIYQMATHFLQLISSILEKPDSLISEINLISPSERKRLLFEFNQTKNDFPKDQTVTQQFEQQVEKYFDKIALVLGEEQLTYSELNQRANQLARLLVKKGVSSNQVIGLMVKRSVMMIIGILGIVKAGGAYLPIDLENPEDRIEFMLADSNAKLLLTDQHWRHNISFLGAIVDINDTSCCKEETTNLKTQVSAENLIYIIYTSGSTGKPKGALISHYNVSWMVKGTKYIKIKSSDRLLQVSNYAFDVSVFDIFAGLLNGAKLFLMKQEDILQLNKIIQTIYHHQISFLFITTALFNALVELNIECFSGVRKILFGGERISVHHVKKALSFLGSERLIHAYGPTESTIFTTYFPINKIEEQSETIPIGRPLANTQVYILNQEGQLQPWGVPGELCISGAGVGKGYLNRPELTAEKFVAHPFIPGQNLYRSGDLVRWNSDGQLEFLDRIDHQVKIRGYRIELGEIEKQLLVLPGIKEAVVIANSDTQNEKFLCAYVVSQEPIVPSKIKIALSDHLPSYMIPTFFLELEHIPLNSNGKVDKRSLPKPLAEMNREKKYAAPTDQLEIRLGVIWSEILGVEPIGIHDNFFALGGHSLKATTLISQITKELQVKVPLKVIFSQPTIYDLANYIRGAIKIEYTKIEVIADKATYPLSSAQKRIYVLHEFEPRQISYNIPSAWWVTGVLDQERLRRAMDQLIRRHASLRTSFINVDGVPVQRIQEQVNLAITHIKAPEEGEVGLEKLVNKFVQPFNLEQAPLFRVGLVRFGVEKCLLIFDIHHIVADGISINVLFDNFIHLYNGNELPKLRIQYKDFTVWQNKYLKSEEMTNHENYWLKRFSNQIPVLNLPTDYPRPGVRNFTGAVFTFQLDSKLTKNLKKLNQDKGVTLYMTLLGVYNILLTKYARQVDCVVGSPIGGRRHAELKNLVGMFVNTLAMHNQPIPSKTFVQFLEEVKINALEAYEHQDYQFETLVEKLDLERDLSRNPLFDVMLSVQNFDQVQVMADKLIWAPYTIRTQIAKFDLHLSVVEKVDLIKCKLEYSTSLFNEETIKRITVHFRQIIKKVVENPNIKLSDIEMLTNEEKERILIFSNHDVDRIHLSSNKMIHQLFEEKVLETPDQIALIFGEDRLTYYQVNNKANRLAWTLIEKGISPDQIVGLMVDRSLEMIIGILAILKAGGSYLPIDPDYPVERINFLLNDSNVQFLLVKGNSKNESKLATKCLDLTDPNNYHFSTKNPKTDVCLDHLAYIIYTSGSTGQPKGVMIEHRSVVNVLSLLQDMYPVNQADAYLLKTAYTFDVSVSEIFGWFLGNGCLVILEKDEEKDPMALIRVIQKEEITHINFVPTMLNVFLNSIDNKNVEALQSLKYVLVAGEKLQNNLVKIYHKINLSAVLENLYGPTETTIYTSRYSFREWNDQIVIPIGKPLKNICMYIVDEENKLQPIGIPGELCIGGAGLARGYLNGSDLTKAKFISNPFKPTEKLYKTGDLVRWMADGNVDFLGRIDYQVKIRGYRIELGELEYHISKHPMINKVVVTVLRDLSNEQYLCAYFVAEQELSTTDLKNFLAQYLPTYMIPAFFVQLTAMPVLANGKLNREMLPIPTKNITNKADYRASASRMEISLIQLWQKILGVSKVGLEDSFFTLGGNSIKATHLVNQIQNDFGVKIPLKGIFENSTIRGLAQIIRNTKENIFNSIEPIEEREHYPVSSAQKRLFIANQSKLNSTTYNIPICVFLEGYLDIKKVKSIFTKLVKRHESLRTSFRFKDGEPVQQIWSDVEFEIFESFLGEQSIDEVMETFLQPFDLSQAPLMRVELVNITREKWFLLIDMHHIISDKRSLDILLKEFVYLYQNKSLEELAIHYKDFTFWQKRLFSSKMMKKQEEYWLQVFQQKVKKLILPTDFSSELALASQGDSLTFSIEHELLASLEMLGQKIEVTLYMILLAVYCILLSKYSNQQDVVIGTPIEGRRTKDLHSIIGMFVNTLALRNYPRDELSITEFLLQVKENTLDAFDNQDYQFEMLLEKLDIIQEVGKNPLFNVIFNYLQADESEELLHLNGLKITPYHFKNNRLISELLLRANKYASSIKCVFEYDRLTFKRSTIQRMADQYLDLLRNVVENPKELLANFEVGNQTEKNRFLDSFMDDFNVN